MGDTYRPMQEERSSRRTVLWSLVVFASILLHGAIFGAGQFATTGRLTRAIEVIAFDASFAEPPEPPPKEEAKKEPEPEPPPPEPIAAKEPEPEPEAEAEPPPPTDTGPDLGAVEGGTGPAMASGNGRGDAPPTPPPAQKVATAAPKAPAKARRGPVRLDQAGTPPKAIKQEPKMGYPRAFREKAISGLVVVQCIITEKGKVRACRAKDGPPELAEYAISIIREWEYEPAKDHGGKPIAVAFTWRFPFRLA